MQQTNRKDYLSIGLSKKEADIIRFYSNDLFRSVSETVRIIVIDYIKKNELEKRYSNLLNK